MKHILDHLESGGVIAYPTETLWGFGADITNENAVQKIFDIKGRDETKAMSVIVRDIDQAKELAYVDRQAEKLMEKLWPGALTLVLPKKDFVSATVTGGSSLVGLRCSPHETVKALLDQFKKPLITTSVNRAGEKPAQKREELDWLPEDVLIAEGESNPESLGSTVVKVADGKVTILREGDLPRSLFEA